MMIWAHPKCQSQVVPPPTISSITAVLASALYNPNLIQDEYSFRFADADTQAIRLASDLLGYDADRSGGIFTFGRTGTILYGCKLALEHLLKGRGMHGGLRREPKIIASRSGASALSALKSFIMSPWTDRKAIDAVVEQILELRTALEKKGPDGPTSRAPAQRAA